MGKFFFKYNSYCKKKGAKVILECGSTHIKEQSRILKEEYANFGLDYSPVDKRIKEKVLQEYQKSDYIFIPSEFVKRTFIKNGIDRNKLIKVSYGVELDRFFITDRKRPEKFKVIFVGMVGIRKGLYYLFKAWEKLNLPINKTELLIVGKIQPEFKYVLRKVKLFKNVKFVDPSSRDELARLYHSSSVFVLPSLEEGLSMVQAEAMASGLPLVCTTNTGGEDLIENGKHGFVLPIKNIDALVEKILWCYQNQDDCFEMGKLAQEKIKGQGWQNYANSVFENYKKILNIV